MLKYMCRIFEGWEIDEIVNISGISRDVVVVFNSNGVDGLMLKFLSDCRILRSWEE